MVLSECTYINANYIKTAFNEECRDSTHLDHDSPSGDIIAS